MMTVETPIGTLLATLDDDGRLVTLSFGAPASSPAGPAASGAAASGGGTPPSQPAGRQRSVETQLHEYFAGKRQTFDLDLNLRGTPFQLAVWNELLRIPFGDTITYAELARRIGKPAAIRAVGAANGANPIPVIVPCHRVIGSNGTLTGYGGGIERKQWLLAHEGRRLF